MNDPHHHYWINQAATSTALRNLWAFSYWPSRYASHFPIDSKPQEGKPR